jgi:hypothetical protein
MWFVHFLKIVKQSPLESFDTELFSTEMEQLPAPGRHSNNQEKINTWETLCKKIIANFFVYIFSCIIASTRQQRTATPLVKKSALPTSALAVGNIVTYGRAGLMLHQATICPAPNIFLVASNFKEVT